MSFYPFFLSDCKTLNEAFRIAVGDLSGNALPYAGGLLDKEKFCLMAGLDYEQPWTRDTAINIRYALSLMDKELCRNTLLSVLEKKDGKSIVAGSYGQTWDNIIWAIGADAYLAVNDDPEFFRLALEVTKNTLTLYENTHFNAELNLFSGQAVYADGIASYPDNVVEKLQTGQDVYALSTNCVYYKAYRICADMAKKAGQPYKEYERKAQAMKSAILAAFPNEKTGLFDYFYRDSDAQEGLGLAYAVLFGIADEKQSKSFFKNAYITPHGIPCEWPPFERYTSRGQGAYGRHCGTVWPMINGAWALAALRTGEKKIFEKELFSLAEKSVRDLHFYEIYHPETGLPYGGLQEWEGEIVTWQPCRKQSWSATSFLAMLFYGIAGLEIANGSVHVAPFLPEGVNEIFIKNLCVRGKTFTLHIVRGSDYPAAFDCATDDLPDTVTLSYTEK